MDEYKEYTTFVIEASNGSDVELAILEEFEFENVSYVATARVVDDMIDDDGIYIYRYIASEDDFDVEKIEDPEEYEKVTNAYLAM